MRILVADDHSIVRSGLKHLLRDLSEHDDIEFIEANSFEAAREAALMGPVPDLLLLDLFAPNPIEGSALKAFCEAVAPSPVVIFSMSENVQDMRNVLDHGAKAFIPKNTDDTLFLSILRMIMAGGTYIPPAMSGAGMAEATASYTATNASSAGQVTSGFNEKLMGLTRRQRDVLTMMAEGLSNKEIGERLGLNINTVKGHVTAILRELGAENRTQAVLMVKQ